jgi:hypothetical protein
MIEGRIITRLAATILLVVAVELGGQQLPEGLEVMIERRFESQDANDDGQLAREEVFEFARKRNPDAGEDVLRQVAMSVQWEFGRIDTDRDGFITREEVAADVRALQMHRGAIEPEDAKLFEGRFSQCSFNALASALIHFHGPTPGFKDRKDVESAAFREPLKSEGFGGFFGWAPWTSYMVNSGLVEWNGRVTDLKAENFSLRTKELPEVDLAKQTIKVSYAPGERAVLEKRFLAQLKRGPVIIWTPYAAVLSPVAQRWKHVAHVDDETELVAFGSFTHAVTLFLKEDGRVAVVDGSTRDGVYYTDFRTVTATGAAMSGFIRIRPPGKGRKTVFERCRRIEDERYHVVVFPVQQ